MKYSKPARTYVEQLQILKDRGLIVPDEKFALHCLEHINYYRLSAYRFPLTVRGDPDQFLDGTTFENIWTLYHFDRTLRRLILDAAKRVEISVRSRWAYELGHRYGSQAYEKRELFFDGYKHSELISKLDNELTRSKEDFVKHFINTYDTNHPPIWAVTEIVSLGLISNFYSKLKQPGDRQVIATTYGLAEKIMGSFLHHLTVVRNISAHHGRIWNRVFDIQFILPRRPREFTKNFQQDHKARRKIYNTLVMLLYLLDIIEPGSHLPGQLYSHIEELDEKYHPMMGFPPDWRERPIWAARQAVEPLTVTEEA